METSKRPLVIGFKGLIGAGKTTLANFLAKNDPATFWRSSFAGTMKSGFAQMGITKEATPELYRAELQRMGAARRADNPDWWINLWASSLPKSHPCIIVDDVRYPNEASNCDILFFLQRTDVSMKFDPHESEAWAHEGPKYEDILLLNDGSLPCLQSMAKTVIQTVSPRLTA